MRLLKEIDILVVLYKVYSFLKFLFKVLVLVVRLGLGFRIDIFCLVRGRCNEVSLGGIDFGLGFVVGLCM